MREFPRLSLDSRLADVWAHPLGNDALSKVLMQLGAPNSALRNPLVSRLRLRTLARLGDSLGKWPGTRSGASSRPRAGARSGPSAIGEEFVTALVDLLNANRELPAPAPTPASAHSRSDAAAYTADHTTAHTAAPTGGPWWKTAVFYQIYPRSFADSNGDGIGDIPGIISKLDYLQDLGIDALWISPVYDSPNDDNGYDIRDYKKIMAEFGTLADIDELISELQSRGMRLVMDLVINHTSDEHPWFQAALADPDSPYRDYYFFRADRPRAENGSRPQKPSESRRSTILDGEEGQIEPPNNWVSFFSGPAWRHYPTQNTWAMHLFSSKQMDLNWEHAPMREELYEMVRWWLARGVDGFRLDVINYISKPPGLPDGNELIGSLMEFTGIEQYFVGPRLHEHLQELRREAFAPGTVAIGETPGIGPQTAKLLTEPGRGELDMVFTFDHLETPGHTRFDDYRYNLEFLRDYLTEYITDYGATCHPALFYENHDNPRMISKVDPRPGHRRTLGRLLALIQLTLPGTPFIFQGQELGATNELFTDIGQLRDVESINRHAQLLAAGNTAAEAFSEILAGTRDHARTPMAWDPSGGFTTGTPWLPSPTPNRPNVEESLTDPTSVLAGYRELIALRRDHATLSTGRIVFGPKKRGRWRYVRIDDDGEPAFRMEANLTDRPRAFTEPGPGWEVVFTTGGQLTHSPFARGTLGPYDGRLYRRRG